MLSAEEVFVISWAVLIAMKIVVFIIGYLTVRLGYRLIQSGVKGEFKFSASLGGAKADLASVSPGLLFVLLGVGLVGYGIFVPKPLEVSSSAPIPAPVESAVPSPDEVPFSDKGKAKKDGAE